MKAAKTVDLPKVIQLDLEEQGLGPRPWRMCCLLQPLGPLHRAGRLQFLAIEGQGSGRVHPGGCAARRPGCLLRFLPLQQPGAGRGRGGEIKQAGQPSPPGVSQAGLAASRLSQLRNWETLHCPPKRKCP